MIVCYEELVGRLNGGIEASEFGTRRPARLQGGRLERRAALQLFPGDLLSGAVPFSSCLESRNSPLRTPAGEDAVSQHRPSHLPAPFGTPNVDCPVRLQGTKAKKRRLFPNPTTAHPSLVGTLMHPPWLCCRCSIAQSMWIFEVPKPSSPAQPCPKPCSPTCHSPAAAAAQPKACWLLRGEGHHLQGLVRHKACVLERLQGSDAAHHACRQGGAAFGFNTFNLL